MPSADAGFPLQLDSRKARHRADTRQVVLRCVFELLASVETIPDRLAACSLAAQSAEDPIVGRWLRHRATLSAHTSFVKSVAVRRDGALLVSASADGVVIVWDPSLARGARGRPHAFRYGGHPAQVYLRRLLARAQRRQRSRDAAFREVKRLARPLIASSMYAVCAP